MCLVYIDEHLTVQIRIAQLPFYKSLACCLDDFMQATCTPPGYMLVVAARLSTVLAVQRLHMQTDRPVNFSESGTAASCSSHQRCSSQAPKNDAQIRGDWTVANALHFYYPHRPGIVALGVS